MAYKKSPKYIHLKMSQIQKAVSEELCYMLFIPEKYTLFAKRPELPIDKVEGGKTA